MPPVEFKIILDQLIAPVGWIFLFGFGGIGWSFAYQVFKENTDLKKRLGRE